MKPTHAAITAALVLLGAASCRAPITTSTSATGDEVSASSSTPRTTTGTDSTEAAGGPVLTGRGCTNTDTGLLGPVPAPGSCHLRHTAAGDPLPDPHCTPGAVDRAVTASNTFTTICRKGGYTSSIRAPQALTSAAKRKVLAAYGIPHDQVTHYELDHLVELSAGGSSDYRNLWPEPNTFKTSTASQHVSNDKDTVEAYLFHATCTGKVRVNQVQNAMTTNWSTAVKALGLPPIRRDTADDDNPVPECPRLGDTPPKSRVQLKDQAHDGC